MKNKLKRIAASVLTLALLAVPVLAAAEPVGSRSLNVADGTVYTYSTQAVTSDSGKQTNLHENIFTYKKEAQVRPGRRLRLDALRHQPHEQDHQDA